MVWYKSMSSFSLLFEYFGNNMTTTFQDKFLFYMNIVCVKTIFSDMPYFQHS